MQPDVKDLWYVVLRIFLDQKVWNRQQGLHQLVANVQGLKHSNHPTHQSNSTHTFLSSLTQTQIFKFGTLWCKPSIFST